MSETEILEPLAFNCAFPNSPCSVASECRQIRHCKYILTTIKDDRIADLKRELAEAKAINAQDLEKLAEAVELGSKQAEEYDRVVADLKKQAADKDRQIEAIVERATMVAKMCPRKFGDMLTDDVRNFFVTGEVKGE